jgi:hypothetical protein
MAGERKVRRISPGFSVHCANTLQRCMSSAAASLAVFARDDSRVVVLLKRFSSRGLQ